MSDLAIVGIVFGAALIFVILVALYAMSDGIGSGPRNGKLG